MKLFHIIKTRKCILVVQECAVDGALVSHIEKASCLQVEQSQHVLTQLMCSVHQAMRIALHTAISNYVNLAWLSNHLWIVVNWLW